MARQHLEQPVDDTETAGQGNNDRVNAYRRTVYRAIDYRAVRRAIPLSQVLELLGFHPARSRVITKGVSVGASQSGLTHGLGLVD